MIQNDIRNASYSSYSVPTSAQSEHSYHYGESEAGDREYQQVDSGMDGFRDWSTSATDCRESGYPAALAQRNLQMMQPVEGPRLQSLKETMDSVADTTRHMIAGAKVIGATVGAVTTPILGSLSRGITQTVVDARQYESWASNNVESWGWNDTKFGYASGLAVRAISTTVGGAVGLAHGIWAGGKQAYDNYNGEGVFKGAWQAISNAFYACEPTRFSNPAE